jgi:hypothetical protein
MRKERAVCFRRTSGPVLLNACCAARADDVFPAYRLPRTIAPVVRWGARRDRGGAKRSPKVGRPCIVGVETRWLKRKALSLGGRHSLVIYLLHQPSFLTVLYLVVLVIRPA